MAYGYNNKLTSGVSETLFAPNTEASLQMYVTFVLRALGYTDNESGTVWENWEAWGTAAGVINAETRRDKFVRGDAVIISRAALDAKIAGTDKTLKQQLSDDMVVSPFALSIVEAKEGKVIDTSSPLMDILAKTYAGVPDIYPEGLMTMQFKAEDGKYYIFGDEAEKEEYINYLASFIGADAEKIGVTEAICCEPMMSSRAHSVAVIRVKDGTDMEMAKKEIKEKVDPRKWVCVSVNPANVRVENVGNVILMAMDNTIVDRLCANFRSLDTTLAKPSENGYMLIDGRYVEAEEPYSESSAQRFAEKFTSLREKHFADNKVYFATIPEKGYYLRDKTTHYLSHDSITAFLSEALYDWTMIDVAGSLTIDDYYTTDRHWKQENLFGVMEKFGEKMGFTVNKDAYTPVKVENYRGDYAKVITDIPAETLTYLVSDVTKGATVDNFQNKKVTTVYDEAKLTSKIPYDVFLSGATPLTVITNPAAKETRELIIFRDSFGSSIIPLFIEAYSKITVVDLRYMTSELLPQFVEFGNAEILVMVSDKIVNNSILLKITESTNTAQNSKSTSKKSTAEIKKVFLEFIELGINCQTSAINNLNNHIKYNDESYKTLFFENIGTARDAVNSAYEISIEYSDMNNLSALLEKILNIYDDILNDEYALLTIGDIFKETLSYYESISSISKSWLY